MRGIEIEKHRDTLNLKHIKLETSRKIDIHWGTFRDIEIHWEILREDGYIEVMRYRYIEIYADKYREIYAEIEI